MMYVFCETPSNGARDLCQILDAKRLRKFDGLNFLRKGRPVSFEEGDVIICWGTPVPEIEGVKILNFGDVRTRTEMIKALQTAGLMTVPMYGKQQYGNSLIPRRKGYTFWEDFSSISVGTADFYTQKVNFVKEYRIHSFSGKAIRVGLRVPREGRVLATDETKMNLETEYHPWIRTWETGWTVDYTPFDILPSVKTLAHKTVSILGLTFGAVDIGESTVGDKYIIDVKLSPPLDTQSLTSYVRGINRWLKEEPKPPKPEKDDEDPIGVEWVDPLAERERRRAAQVTPTPANLPTYTVKRVPEVVPRKAVDTYWIVSPPKMNLEKTLRDMERITNEPREIARENSTEEPAI